MARGNADRAHRRDGATVWRRDHRSRLARPARVLAFGATIAGLRLGSPRTEPVGSIAFPRPGVRCTVAEEAQSRDPGAITRTPGNVGQAEGTPAIKKRPRVGGANPTATDDRGAHAKRKPLSRNITPV